MKRTGARRRPRAFLAAIAILLATLCLAAPAAANRALLDESVLLAEPEVEGACGLAVVLGRIYVSDYYHRAVKGFSLSSGKLESQISLPGGGFTGVGINSLDSVCGLATGPGGALYANEWHQGVTRLLPGELPIESGRESTGVAVDPVSGDVYVDDRSYVAVYEASGAAVEVAGSPLHIGEGSLGDAYGLAVDPSGERVFVADGASNSIEVFEPAVDAAVPAATISHGFVSLADAALAVDPTNGHLIVADNLQPGFEHPEAALEEFDAAGAYLGRLPCGPVDGEPSGLAFDLSGNLYVTNGNGEGSNVFKYGLYTASTVPTPTCAAAAAAGASGAATASGSSSQPVVSGGALEAAAGFSVRGPAAGSSTVVQHRGVRVSFQSAIRPQRLPRHGSSPVRISLDVKIRAPDGGIVPQLRRVTIEFNRAGRLHPEAVPACTVERIQPSTTSTALAACGRSLVGEGSFSADVRLPQQSPFPAKGKVLAFNGRYKGQPAILAHVYGTSPVPTSYTLPFVLASAHGTYGTMLRASLPPVAGDAAAITDLTMTLGRSLTAHGRRTPYISAGCPAPKGFSSASFPLARGRFAFTGGAKLSEVVTRACGARGR